MHSIIRICAHVVASESRTPILDIAPEIGLSRQQYKCAECAAPLNLSELFALCVFLKWLLYFYRSDSV